MSTFDSHFHYQADLKTHEIRLLRVSPSTNKDIHCSLIIESFSENIVYDALSYVWGHSTKKQQITCNGQQLDVTENLYAALRYISECRSNHLLWVDAICINQNNATEKTSQVRMMTEIYAQARQVVVWLGEEEKGDRKGYALAEVIASKPIKINHDHEEKRRDLQDPRWTSLSRLLTKPWFSRIWIVQEFLVAKSAVFVCGRLEMQPTVILKAAVLVTTRVSASSVFSMHNDLGLKLNNKTLPNNAINFATLIGYIQKHRECSLLYLLTSTWPFQATDQRDKIFALLALSDDFSTSLINYEQIQEDLLLGAVTQMLSEKLRIPTAMILLSVAVNLVPSKDLPSWVPNWMNQQYTTIPLVRALDMDKGIDESQFHIDPSQPKVLRMRGKMMDHITDIVWPTSDRELLTGHEDKDLAVAIRVNDWLEKARRLAYASRLYANEAEAREVFLRTLIGNFTASTEPLSPEQRSSYQAWQTTIKEHIFLASKLDTILAESIFSVLLNVLYVGLSLRIWYLIGGFSVVRFVAWLFSWLIAANYILATFQWIASFHPRYIPDYLDRTNKIAQTQKQMRLFDELCARISSGRRFCRTEKGYVGWVSANAREGDAVVGFVGFRIPFTIRNANIGGEDKAGEPATGQYKLTGDCFIYGRMDKDLEVEGPIVDIILV